jgi:NAD(P)-dependent dehydrogenase (short-subunit alcohol dehydrogenase family)
MADGPVLLVTGGSRGIGAAVCILAAKQGWRVAVNFVRNGEAAQSVVKRIKAMGGEALAVQGDASEEEDIAAIYDVVDNAFGRLDGLVNNAGIIGMPVRVDEMSRERIERMFKVNVLGPMRVAAEAVKRMSTRHGGEGGEIVNLSSAAAMLGSPGEFVDYAASKGAIDVFTLGLAKEVADEGIRVNAVRPGLIHTDIQADAGNPNRAHDLAHAVPMKRAGEPEEVASTILFLLSNEASYVTGAVLNVTGGR